MSFTQDQRYIDSTDKERRFLDEYAIDKDIARAILTAYDIIGDREKARRYGLAVMARERIAGIIADYIAPAVEKTLPDRDELRQHYMDIFYNSASTVREKLQALTAYERISGFNKTAPKSAEDQYDALDDITV
jgi:hypothetical protein